MLDGIPVIDGIIHAYNLDPSNYANRHAAIVSELIVGMVSAMSRPGFVAPRDVYLRDWSIEDTAKLVFTESDTDLAVYHVLPLNAFRDGMCSFEKAVEARRRWPNRIVCYCGVDPLQGDAALDELHRQVEILQPIGLKLYPNSWTGNEAKGWRMDDPEVAFPVFDRAQKLGLKVVAIHKAVPLGPVPMDAYRVDDIDRAAMAFPKLNFEVVHGGMAFLEETAWQLARFPNVFINLEVTSAYVATRPKAFDRVFAALMSIAGRSVLDRVIWGTGAIAFHPQPLLESFVREFQFSDETMACTGVAQLTVADKRRILFDNFSLMSGIDLGAMLAATEGDEFEVSRRTGRLPPFSTYRTGNV
jgi:predicted TIM-barrel fold metal-dependent hydrolase